MQALRFTVGKVRLHVMSKMFADEIQKVRIKASTACHDAALLAAMLDEFD
jgi:hypothetical protein